VEVHAGGEALAAAAAAYVAEVLAAAIAERGTASIALSGGSAPPPVYRALAAPPLRSRVDWSRVEVFWGDERAVPPDDAESNYRLARETLLSGVPVDPGRVHRMRGELDPRRAARLYEEELILTLGAGSPDGTPPRLDLVHQGLGPDGPTASLFPSLFAGHEADVSYDPHPGRLAAATEAPDEPRRRITLTLSCLCAARHVLFVAAGDRKADAVARSLAAEPPLTPGARLRPWAGDLVWMLDRAAAGER
jgi:6-phosphogluconolactonase